MNTELETQAIVWQLQKWKLSCEIIYTEIKFTMYLYFSFSERRVKIISVSHQNLISESFLKFFIIFFHLEKDLLLLLFLAQIQSKFEVLQRTI